MPALPSFYEVLNLDVNCSAADVRRAYHQAARRYHPDKRSNDVGFDSSDGSVLEDEKQFLRVQEAYETLRSDELRHKYDAKLLQDDLVRKREEEVVVVSDEVTLTDMQRQLLPGEGDDEDEVLYTHQCRCGDLYEITEDELQEGVDVVPCTGCSLHIRVLQGNPR
ncbi:DPH4 [Phytophthora citrophthora]|uniref:DPH4 n=1 Tax=Phytophthora citrophthora TaxID=4793 RepID=A0AAD9G1J4_9STRA|nr:DPH4 [Phytophthora citrophthora]